jgi:hypothetical protein
MWRGLIQNMHVSTGTLGGCSARRIPRLEQPHLRGAQTSPLSGHDNEDANFDVHLPAGSDTSVTVPAEFLEAGRDYVFEVLAIEAGGDQTISEGCFAPAGTDLG